MSPILEVCAIFILSCATPTLTRPSAYVQEQHGSLIAISWNLSVYFTGNETNTIIASATEYLGKFGWVRPQKWFSISPRSNQTVEEDGFELRQGESGSRFDADNPSQANTEIVTEFQSQTNDDVSSALREYQRSNGLSVSGYLDSSTMLSMSQLRCGVPDKIKDLNMTGSSESFDSYNSDEDMNGSSFPVTISNTLLRRRRRYAGPLISPRKQTVILGDDKPFSWSRNELVPVEEPPEEDRMATIDKALSALRKEKEIKNKTLLSLLSSNPPSRPSALMRNHVSSLLEKIISTEKEQDKNNTRRKRSYGLQQFPRKGGWGMVIAKNTITWRLVRQWPHTKNLLMSHDQVRLTMREAFRMWSEILPKNFQEDNSSPVNQVDILIGFGKGRHNRCTVRFSNHLFAQEYAHAWALPKSEIHFNDDKFFVPIVRSSARNNRASFFFQRFRSTPISLFKVAMHEIGHTLGLNHDKAPFSVMNPTYQPYHTNNVVELSVYDRYKVQRMYGACNISFDAAFDWIRVGRNSSGHYKWTFNTYFFRNTWYWLYDNRYRRPRYGDPKLINTKWRGVLEPNDPNQNIDGIVQIRNLDNLEGLTFIFKGSQYLEYDGISQRVKQRNSAGQSYPRRIEDDFRGVPYPIDAVFYKYSEDLLYFFKQNKVYRYRWGKRSLLDTAPISWMFRGWGGASPLPNNLNAAYYSYQYNAFYFFKGTYFWKLADDRERFLNKGLIIPYNSVGPRNKISNKWRFLCDVGPTELVSDLTRI